MTTIRKTMLICALLGTLSGCFEYTPLYKPGVTRLQSENEKAECRISARRRAPPIIMWEREPIYQDGEIVGWVPVQYDANEGRRNALIRQCLTELGYARVSFQLCTDEQLAGRAYVPLRVNPVPGPNICAIRRGPGDYDLIDLSRPQGR